MISIFATNQTPALIKIEIYLATNFFLSPKTQTDKSTVLNPDL